MASIRTFTLPHYEAYPVHVAVFKHVKNAAFLRSQLLAANPEFDYAFLDASMILSPTHLQTALFTTLHHLLTHRLKTHTPHSELVFRLSPTNNIGDSYRVFGIADTSTHIIAVKLCVRGDGSVDEGVTAGGVGAHLGRVVEGESVAVGEEGRELGEGCDLGRVGKVYKLGMGKGVGDGERRREMEGVVLGMIALKGT
ncbi:CGI-121-domain-containing protein [Dothidotthia symphoricarpi CBS 119687]|uniref:EKC/KEOPS complex subunit CGI121 n=1 Tax=Dothidotthia symphoricarpi CBS 119687 TaxID=1392245 RepID=A0A6A5ZZN5_9PLEO|nr:CGI-121-domain-containing protein [Dothidotthia symphoricarpi CBS 119687]KAF2124353.1 CGI-121-domain-containing protein [Dothidotthia symphoricarpi CBS 119687]